MAFDRHFGLRAGLLVIGASLLAALAPAPALGADIVYWDWATLGSDTVEASGISAANLSGRGGIGLPVSGTPVDHPLGMAIDSATGRMYWANFGASINYCIGALGADNTISYANLDGSHGGILNTSGATVSGPDGLAIDPAVRRVYWANDHANSISYANLNGSGGHDLNTTGATVDCPAGVAVDPAAGRVYWTNFIGNTISYANLDGRGGGDLPTPGASVDGPYGLAIDPADGHIYWANNTGNTISYANLDGSGGGDNLATPGATVNGPWGIAIDPGAGRIYWANNLGNSISYANLNESGGADLSTPGAPVDHPKYPVLLEVPRATGLPTVRGGSAPGSTLVCLPDTWAADLPESFLYRAPLRFAYSWSENGVPIVGGSNFLTATSPGSYACRVTAANYAGSSAQTSAPLTILAPSNVISVIAERVSKRGAITLCLAVPGPGTLTGTAKFSGRRRRVVGRVRRRRRLVNPSATGFYGSATVGAAGAETLTLAITPTRIASKLLKAGYGLKVTLGLAFTPTSGTVRHTDLRIRVGPIATNAVTSSAKRRERGP